VETVRVRSGLLEAVMKLKPSRAVTREAAKLLQDGSLAMSELEHNGIRIDVPYLDNQIKEVGAKIRTMEESLRRDKVYREWKRRYGEKTTLGSKQQLATVFFDCLGYERARTQAKKVHSEDENDEKRESKQSEAAFAKVDHPFVKQYFACEKLKKLLSTYLWGIRREVVDGFLHPFFNLHTAVTYRSSSEMPNFQNIPIRNKEIAAIIRPCFIPRKGWHLVEMDYSGIEVRVACCYTKDPQLIKEFTGPDGDPHGDTAVELFCLPRDFVRKNKDWAKKTIRDYAKNRFVFPSFYGSVYFQCAPELWRGVLECPKLPDGRTLLEHLKGKGIKKLGDCEPGAETRKGTFVHHVKQVEEGFWNKRFTVYTEWKQRRWEEYLRDGGFSTFVGFYHAGLFKRNDVLNYPIQGSAFHCLLWSIIRLVKSLKRYKMSTLPIGQIHDCSIADSPSDELQDYLDLNYDITTRQLPKAWSDWIIVPMDVEAEVCAADQNWHTKAQWTKKGDWWLNKELAA
jgi:DNA polymerase-1